MPIACNSNVAFAGLYRKVAFIVQCLLLDEAGARRLFFGASTGFDCLMLRNGIASTVPAFVSLKLVSALLLMR
jgi:hypothetical protein